MKNSQINILYVIKSSQPGGTQSHLYNLLKYMTKMSDFNFHIALPPGGIMVSKFSELGLKIYELPIPRYKVKIKDDLKAFKKLLQILSSNKFHILHLHNSKPGFIGRIAGKLKKVPIIIFTPHLFAFKPYQNKFVNLTHKIIEAFLSRFFCDVVISVSRGAKERVVRKKIIPENKITVIENGIDKPQVSQSEILSVKKEFNISDNDKIVIMVSRLEAQKSPLDFVEIANLVLEKIPDAKFFLIGDGSLKKQVKDLIEKYRIENNVILTGNRVDVHKFYAIADIFLLTSLWEGLPIVVLEAMAFKLPVIATNIEGTNELVIDNSTGYLIDVKNYQAFAEKIIYLLNNPDIAKKMGNNAFKYYSENFTAKIMAEKTLHLYKKLINPGS